MLTKIALSCWLPIATRLSSGMKTSLFRVRTVFSCESRSLLIDPQGDIECDHFFRRTRTTPGAAVLPTMTGIDDDGIEGVTGVDRHGRATTKEGEGDEKRRTINNLSCHGFP